MGIFNRKKDDDDYEELDETVVKRRPKSNVFKDLKPENKKRRKEPKKPWGKSERVYILIIILLTAGTSGILALSARAWKLPRLPKLGLPSISLPFFKEETIVLEGDKDSLRDREIARKVTQEFKEKTVNLSGVYGLYVIHLANGFSYGVNENDTFQAASLIKLPVMVAMYRESEDGRLDLDEKYILKNNDKVEGAGSLYGKPAGYEITYKNLVQLMGKQSDNTAYNITLKLLGKEKVNDTILSLGMADTSLADNETTPKDIGIFFEGLWRRNSLTEKSRDEILAALTDTVYENWLAAEIADEVGIAHKYGREVHVVNDAGIVFTNKPYVIVILSKGVIEREADEIIPKLSRAVYTILTSE